ncbi:hypothetical protein AXX17_AT5G34670 [Arabidopsis thaliana]|uniref:Uncharacterized protein n=1 Tax=Arabidopsis thaliana TaxID=3702 RepID=A0A178UIF3_ARATH|nr:hypothetical protein AXX17_AT5G34670 [Arabidopsis thaliana]
MGRLRRRQEIIDHEEEESNDDVSSRRGKLSLAETFRWLDSSEHRRIETDGHNDYKYIIHPKNRFFLSFFLFLHHALEEFPFYREINTYKILFLKSSKYLLFFFFCNFKKKLYSPYHFKNLSP